MTKMKWPNRDSWIQLFPWLTAMLWLLFFAATFFAEQYPLVYRDSLPTLLTGTYYFVFLAGSGGVCFVIASWRTKAHAVIRSLVVFSAVLTPLILLPLQILTACNGYLDSTNRSVHESVVLSRYVTKGRSRIEMLKVRDWRDADAIVEIRGSSVETFSKPAVGSRIQIVTGGGRLGAEWVEKAWVHD